MLFVNSWLQKYGHPLVVSELTEIGGEYKIFKKLITNKLENKKKNIHEASCMAMGKENLNVLYVVDQFMESCVF